ncbi:hypothetical protein [uncultured Gammaproteobacteria bacterium]|nr:hypothetical protein [uncultured Gammaproteobacteria bacterium]CAC9596105.1 hypothetical protein [uncultured Gammaproteobacteria bacterium]CAC9596765.1 hypothetical protein [uncultured Gammaproteobacteria bacterium]CAC9957388.1 hypothetical protein [uncultured Gammaproteobacteria bacterium]CAC9959409.1 hypothetical protein [uncultured Gammaproteobacteria bacterium]
MQSFVLSIVTLFFLFVNNAIAQDVYAQALLLKPNLDNGKRELSIMCLMSFGQWIG